jgi:two-component sensor histidine kinase
VNNPTIADAEIRLANPLVSAALWDPPERAPYLQAEVTAFCELSKILADDPRVALRRFLETALRLCKAGSAGMSLLRSSETSQKTVHWEAISGALASHDGSDATRDFSVCGLCLEAGMTILLSRPERVFTYLRETRPSIVQDLIVPSYEHASQPLGTLWIAHHDSVSQFSSDDARMMEQLAGQLILALRLLEQAREHRHALDLLESHRTAQRALAHALAEELSRRERAEASESGIRGALEFKYTLVREVHHRVKNTIQMAASLLSSHARATPSAQVRRALQESYGRLRLLAKVHELLYASADNTQEVLLPPLLQALGDALRQSFAETSGRVRLQITADPVVLSPDEAIPIALLANEAITNAYKHAFPEGSAGEIALNLSCTAEQALVMQISDNGVGMHADGFAGGLGLKLIRVLAAQLRGTVTFAEPADAVGTAVTLSFHCGAKRRPGLETRRADCRSPS